jgi:hypothetical protein
VKDALAEALAYNDGPVVVDRLALSLPSHVPFHVAKGLTLSSNSREDTVFFVPHVDKVDFSVPTKRVNHGIQCISDYPVTAFHSCLFQHFPHRIRYVSCHQTSPTLKMRRRYDRQTASLLDFRCCCK